MKGGGIAKSARFLFLKIDLTHIYIVLTIFPLLPHKYSNTFPVVVAYSGLNVTNVYHLHGMVKYKNSSAK